MELQKDQIAKSKRILVVEDEPSVRKAICLVLAIDDHQTTEAGNGVEALSIFKPNSFDLVLTDLRMPLMRGNELAARIREQAPQQPIVMLTGFLEETFDSQTCVDEVLDKPTTLAQLRGAIASALTPKPRFGDPLP